MCVEHGADFVALPNDHEEQLQRNWTIGTDDQSGSSAIRIDGIGSARRRPTGRERLASDDSVLDPRHITGPIEMCDSDTAELKHNAGCGEEHAVGGRSVIARKGSVRTRAVVLR